MKAGCKEGTLSCIPLSSLGDVWRLCSNSLKTGVLQSLEVNAAEDTASWLLTSTARLFTTSDIELLTAAVFMVLLVLPGTSEDCTLCIEQSKVTVSSTRVGFTSGRILSWFIGTSKSEAHRPAVTLTSTSCFLTTELSVQCCEGSSHMSLLLAPQCTSFSTRSSASQRPSIHGSTTSSSLKRLTYAMLQHLNF